MILREAGAVILIIGSAVVGPIVPQFKGEECAGGWYTSENVVGAEGHKIELCRRGYKASYETSAETCTRAMKEIGAEKDKAPMEHRGWWWVDGDMRVRCIPAPSGLKR